MPADFLESRNVPGSGDAHGVILVVVERMEAKGSDVVAHLGEAEILPDELEAIAEVDLRDFFLPLGQDAGRGIERVDVAGDAVFLGIHGHALQYGLLGGIFLLIYGSVRDGAGRLRGAVVQTHVVPSENVVKVDGPRAEEVVVELRKE